MNLHVCVIGAGPSGLITIKELIEEGHTVTCYEQGERVGGVFGHDPDKGDSFFKTHLTVSNYFMAYSCYPPKEPIRDFWNFKQYSDYLSDFCEQYKILENIQFHTSVKEVEMLDNRKIKVMIKNKDNIIDIQEFDAIAICTGANHQPKRPDFVNESLFKGKILHSSDYNSKDAFKEKKVVCIGVGESAADLMHEIASVSKSCVLSMRRYPMVVPRYPFGLPHTSDAYTSRAILTIPKATLVNRVLSYLSILKKLKKLRPIEALVGDWLLQSPNPVNQFATKNDLFLENIIAGELSVNPSGIKELTEDSVIFNDGKKEKADIILCNTGYCDQFSFIKNFTIKHVRELYKHIFHPKAGSQMAFIGYARPEFGGIPVASELQARYFAQLCSQKKHLPEATKLMELIKSENENEDNHFSESPYIKSLVMYYPYMEGLAELIGCKPKFRKLIYKPKLLYKVWYGSLVSAQYRLHGPNEDFQQAAKTILALPVGFSIFHMIATAVLGAFIKVKKAI